jgi:hypothetical protein
LLYPEKKGPGNLYAMLAEENYHFAGGVPVGL